VPRTSVGSPATKAIQSG